MNYREASEKLGSRESRKVGNNTYLERRGEDIAVRLHATDVITFHADQLVTYRSGGYESVTTKDRLNNFGPDNIRVFAVRRVWFVEDRFSREQTPFLDGMTFDPENLMASTAQYRTGAESALAEQKKAEARIDRFVRKLTPARLTEIAQAATQPLGLNGDCLLCRMEWSQITTDGRKASCLTSGDTSHLKGHIKEDYWHASLICAALAWAGYKPEFVLGMPSIVNRTVKRYLKSRLISAPKVAA
jgi:hypothetical protein